MKVLAELRDIEAVVSMLDATGLTYPEIAQRVKDRGGKITPTTISNWFNRKVQMPQLAKIIAVAHAFDFKLLIVKNETSYRNRRSP